ncbi:hypothetical protein B0T24DRAFT_663011 [Lasiosphaeria ovina]|uniref:Ankyrin n=1 Tax=Lasiosphaeria ovina TaxID=92902 RepID=A0AAE0KM20_9PEZI|nr:hypothetical protein B0T24DRAFT_663011 [Lasiosphaeria ovina]
MEVCYFKESIDMCVEALPTFRAVQLLRKIDEKYRQNYTGDKPFTWGLAQTNSTTGQLETRTVRFIPLRSLMAPRIVLRFSSDTERRYIILAIHYGNTGLVNAMLEPLEDIANTPGHMTVAQLQQACGTTSDFTWDKELEPLRHFNFLASLIINRSLSQGSIGPFKQWAEASDGITQSFINEASVWGNTETPLLLAVDGLCISAGAMRPFSRQPILMHLLSTSDVALDAQDNRGRTPLHVAVWLGKFWEAQRLVERGARLDIDCPELGAPLNCAFSEPPYYFKFMGNGPTKAMVTSFIEGRNTCTRYLRTSKRA